MPGLPPARPTRRDRTVMFDLVIKGGQVACEGEPRRRDIAISRGRIAAVSEAEEEFAGRKVVDAAGMIVLPGLVDAHVHIPGFRQASRLENFETGTKAAAAGGITTVMLMPTDDPRTVTRAYFDRKRAIGEAESFVDFALQAMVSPRSEQAEIVALAEAGAISFEVFLAYGGNPSFVIGEEDFELQRVFSRIADLGGIIGITPHSGPLIARLTAEQKRIDHNRRFRDETEREVVPPIVQSFSATRPGLSEALGITRACTIAAETGSRLHVRALSTARSVAHVRRFGSEIDVSTEAMVHHLLFSEQEAFEMGPMGVIVPPIRPPEERDSLRAHVREGLVDMVVSDHSPVLLEDKEKGWEDIWRTPPGMTGLQTMLLSMLALVDEGILSIADVVRVCCRQPAVRFGLFPRKGVIARGADADLVLIDPGRSTLLSDAQMESRARYTTMKGRIIPSRIDSVFLRGRQVVSGGEVIGRPRGRFVAPRQGS